ncbi:hypothetical protein [Streptomyces syringium]|uniref:hypothetical protein n=1 Tax=Streptomyces syringium TaxID=76729 RepID=UPI00343DE79F
MPRLRTIITAAASALTLLLALPGSASAEVSGHFYYSYTDANGDHQVDLYTNQEGECTDVKEVADGDAKFAFSPLNKTTNELWVFTELTCTGDKFILAADAQGTQANKFASYYFVPPRD